MRRRSGKADMVALADLLRSEATLLAKAVERAEARGCDRLAADLDAQAGRLQQLAELVRTGKA